MSIGNFFRWLGAPLKNVRWSWGAVRGDGTVFLRVWQDETEILTGKRYVRLTKHSEFVDDPANPGWRERLAQIQLIQNGSRCYLVMCEPRLEVLPKREIKDFNAEEVFSAGALIEHEGDTWIEFGVRTPARSVPASGSRAQSMSLSDALRRVAHEYPTAQQEEFKEHHLAVFLRQELPQELRALLGPDSSRYLIKGSAGQSKWSNSPWLAIFDPVVTDSAQRGYYPVFLFHEKFDRVSLVLGQGTYSVREEFNRRAAEILDIRARLLRERVPERRGHFSDGPFPIRSSNHAGGDWSTASAWGKSYDLASMPSDEELLSDIRAMLRTYHLATMRGGVALEEDDTTRGVGSEDASGDGDADDDSAEIEGHQRERLHTRIETQRKSKLAVKAKRLHGTTCKACGFSFPSKYGATGDGFIEAHHLVPLAILALDGPVPVDPRKDFTVLCANCHRMIHRAGCPSLDDFKKFLV